MSKPDDAKSPDEYIARLEEPRREQVATLHDLITKTVPNLEPHIQSGMIGYGSYHYTYKSGREGDWFVVGLASQKRYISLYVSATDGDEYVAEKYRSRLPKADIGKSCIRIKKLDNVDLDVLAEIIRDGARAVGSA
jgi:uncharacterized protein YdhG (YjbR/CyaY superfamily)